MTDELLTDRLQELKGSVVVLDAVSRYVFIGTLDSVEVGHLILINADVHDLRDTQTTRERYVLEVKALGVRANRRRVLVRRDAIVSVSMLDSVIE